MKKASLVFLIVAFVFAACFDFSPEWPSQRIERSELYGRYIGNFGETDINYIDLLEDSTFISFYKTPDGHLYVDTGTWDFADFGRNYALYLDNYWRRYPWECLDTEKSETKRGHQPGSSIGLILYLYKRDYGIKIIYCSRKMQHYYYLKNGGPGVTTWDYVIRYSLLFGGILALVSGIVFSKRKRIKPRFFMGLFFFGIYAFIVIICLIIMNFETFLLWL